MSERTKDIVHVAPAGESGSASVDGAPSVEAGLDAADASVRPTHASAGSQPAASGLIGMHGAQTAPSEKGGASAEHVAASREPEEALQVQPSPVPAEAIASPLDHAPLTIHRQPWLREGPVEVPESQSPVLREEAAEALSPSRSPNEPAFASEHRPEVLSAMTPRDSASPEPPGQPTVGERTSPVSAPTLELQPAGTAALGAIVYAKSKLEESVGQRLEEPPLVQPEVIQPERPSFSSLAAPEIVHRQAADASSEPPGLPAGREAASGSHPSPSGEPVREALNPVEGRERHPAVVHKTIGPSESRSAGKEDSPDAALPMPEPAVRRVWEAGEPTDDRTHTIGREDRPPDSNADPRHGMAGESALALRAVPHEAADVLQASTGHPAVRAIIAPRNRSDAQYDPGAGLELIYRQASSPPADVEAVKAGPSSLRRELPGGVESLTVPLAPGPTARISRQESVEMPGTSGADPHAGDPNPGSRGAAEASVRALQLDRGGGPQPTVGVRPTPADDLKTAEPLPLHQHVDARTLARVSSQPRPDASVASSQANVGPAPAHEPTAADRGPFHHLADSGMLARVSSRPRRNMGGAGSRSDASLLIGTHSPGEPITAEAPLQHLAVAAPPVQRAVTTDRISRASNEADAAGPIEHTVQRGIEGAMVQRVGGVESAVSGRSGVEEERMGRPNQVSYAPGLATVARTPQEFLRSPGGAQPRASGAVPAVFPRITHLNQSQQKPGATRNAPVDIVPGLPGGMAYRLPADAALAEAPAPLSGVIAAPTQAAPPPGAVPTRMDSVAASKLSDREVKQLADTVYGLLVRRLTSEKDRRGIGDAI
jgi:hypothetical protein